MARKPKRSALVPVKKKPARRELAREDLSGHHPEVQEAIEPALERVDAEQDLLKRIAVVLTQMKDDAVQARKNSGIEDIWRRCEEAYVGIDDMNRGEFASMRWAKPMDPSGPVTTGRPIQGAAGNNRSNLYLRLTARYVDAGYAKIGEVILPPDGRSFSLSETPDPDLIEARNDKRHLRDESTGLPLTRPLMAGEVPPGVAPAAAAPPPSAPAGPPPGTPVPAASSPAGGVPPAAPLPGPAAGGAAPPAAGAPTPAVPGVTPPAGPGAGRVPLTVADLAEENIQLARKRAKKAETRIYDWHVETHYRAEARKSLFDAAKLGVGVLKGPVPVVKKAVATSRGADGKIKIIFKEKIIPASVQVSPWNCFPDPTCGEDFHNGNHFFERDWLSEKQLRDLADEPGYIRQAILDVIKEGPDKIHQRRENGEIMDPGSSRDSTKGRYEIWYFHGFLKKHELNAVCDAAGMVGDDSEKEDDEQIPTIATMVNDRMIKAVPTVLESGRLPYDSMPWTRRAGHWAGIGIAEQLFAPQRMLNGANRAMMNNAGKSAGSQIVVDQTAIRPVDGSWTMTPDKFWYKTGEAVQAIKDVFEIYDIPNITDKMLAIIKFALEIADESTNIPLISQGLSGRDMAPIPETLGHAQIENSNANQLLRSVGYAWDECVTEPKIERYYEYLLLDPDVPEDEKGDFQIDAHGSVSMVERSIQDATIAQMGPLTLNPAYGMNPKSWSKQMIKSKKLNPDDFMYTPEEQQKLDSTPPAKDPRVEAAEVTMKGWVAEAQVKAASDDKKTTFDHDAELRKLAMQREIAILGYATQHKKTLLDVQSELTQTSLKVQAEERLNAANQAHEKDVEVAGHAVDLHKHHNPPAPPPAVRPPVQAPGRARNGRAFSQERPQ